MVNVMIHLLLGNDVHRFEPDYAVDLFLDARPPAVVVEAAEVVHGGCVTGAGGEGWRKGRGMGCSCGRLKGVEGEDCGVKRGFVGIGVGRGYSWARQARRARVLELGGDGDMSSNAELVRAPDSNDVGSHGKVRANLHAADGKNSSGGGFGIRFVGPGEASLGAGEG